MYAAALDAAPGHKDAPAAAINSAFCYKQVGEFDKAIKLYQKFIDELRQRGHPRTACRTAGSIPRSKRRSAPTRRSTRSASSTSGWRTTRCRPRTTASSRTSAPAESFGKIASNPRFDDSQRANAARIAMVLYSNLGDRANMNKMYAVLVDPKMHLTTDKRAEADYLKASFDYAQWNPAAGESTGNSRRSASRRSRTSSSSTRRTRAGPSRRATSSSRRTASPR